MPFQSTGSSRSPTIWRSIMRYVCIISIHRLLAEPDAIHLIIFVEKHISIHRLLAEPDSITLPALTRCCDFNPQAPRGARLISDSIDSDLTIFQSTGSSRSPTTNRLDFRAAEIISIHRLLAEPDTYNVVSLPYRSFISIHRLLAEPDSKNI